MIDFTRRTLLKALAALALLLPPVVSPATEAGAINIRMIEDASIWDYGTADGVNRLFKEYHAGAIYNVPEDIDEDWADSMIGFGLAERL